MTGQGRWPLTSPASGPDAYGLLIRLKTKRHGSFARRPVRSSLSRGAASKEGLAVANTDVGLAVVLGPIILAIVVLVAIELTDRIPFSGGRSQDDAAGRGSHRSRRIHPRT